MTQVGPIRVNTRTFVALFEKNSLSTKISSCKKSDVILELLGRVHYMEKKKKTEPLASLEMPWIQMYLKLLPKDFPFLRVYHRFLKSV